MTNEKQFAVTWLLYSTDNCDKLVANGIPIRVPTDDLKWVEGEFLFPEDRTNTDLLLEPTKALPAREKSILLFQQAFDRPSESAAGVELS